MSVPINLLPFLSVAEFSIGQTSHNLSILVLMRIWIVFNINIHAFDVAVEMHANTSLSPISDT